jgi:poly-gamma-glutamate capsule biosynthesis protein CapA/YwtB (metallophosphatase superfamily)
VARPAEPFFFRAPPAAIETLAHLGVDCVTLANNHALDFGTVALVDTLELLRQAGIATVGAGANAAEAHRPAVLERNGFRVGIVGVPIIRPHTLLSAVSRASPSPTLAGTFRTGSPRRSRTSTPMP